MSTVRPQDATMYWLSRRTRNDLFLLYCFAESELSTDQLRSAIEHRSAAIPDLRVRLRPAPAGLAYPAWVPCGFDHEQFVEHELPQDDWAHLEDALGELLGSGVDAAVHPWRIHVFRRVTGAPRPAKVSDDDIGLAGFAAAAPAGTHSGSGSRMGSVPPPSRAHDGSGPGESADSQPVTVAVLQMSHALADGKRAAGLARALFAPSEVRHAGSQARGRAGLADDARPARWGDRSRTRTGAVDSDGLRPPTQRAVSAAADLARSGADTVRLGVAAISVPVGMVRTMVGGVRAYLAQRELAELTAAGELPEAGGGFAPSVLNGPGEVRGHRVRMIVCPEQRLRVPGFSVTVVALTAVSIALARYLERRDAPMDRLGAQVPMALPTPHPVDRRDENLVRRVSSAIGDVFARLARAPRNNYRSLGIDLYAGEPNVRRRAEHIAADLAARRTRAAHPLLSVQDRVTAGLPAPILRRDVDRYPIDTVPDFIAGHTVVSSVHRGPADLTFGSAPVLFTAGFPALGSVMHLTHGIHGLGDTITLSIHADPETVPDLDLYAELLRVALEEVSAAGRGPRIGPAAC
ncbi:DUF1298 domain-containing protein [Nocardia cyriacigeorgica]|nr:WS/DGAT domain-containing protein [Nocardia cyriacigeorgica]NEW52598.1 DUF1298 domain-containing protein [Nocardia cyriacigeorgica]